MNRLTLTLAVVLITAGCGGDDDTNNTNANPNNGGTNTAANNGVATGLAERPPLEEPTGCFDEAETTPFTQTERDYGMATGTAVEMYRADYYAHCGSSKKVEIDWLAILSAEGFEEVELETPGVVVDAMKPLLIAADAFCFDSETYSRFVDNVDQVVFTATEDSTRVGHCYDAGSKTIVSRFLLTPGDGTAEFWNQEQSVEWLDSNL